MGGEKSGLAIHKQMRMLDARRAADVETLKHTANMKKDSSS